MRAPPQRSDADLVPGHEPAASSAAGSGAWAAVGRDHWVTGLVLVALAAGAVRFLGLDRWSLWIDEAFTLADARHGAGALNPLGYALFRWLYSFDPGQPSELQLRLPAAVLGWACVPLTYLAFARVIGRRPAAAAALLVALSPWHLYWSQNARFYTLAQALCLAGTWGLVSGLRAGRSGRLALGFAAFVLAVGTQPSAALFAGAIVLACLVARRRDLGVGAGGDPELARGRRRAWVLLGALSMAVVVVGSFWTLEVYAMWNRRQGQGSLAHLVKSVGYLYTPALVLGSVWGAWLLLARRERGGLLVLVLVVAALGTAAAGTFFLRVSAQYTFVLFPAVAALAAVPFQASRGLRPAYLVLLALPLAVETGLYFSLRHGDRPRWREAFALVFEARAPDDLVLAMESPVGQYYWNPASDDLRQRAAFVYLNEFNARVPLVWSRQGRPMWLILNREQLWDWSTEDRDRMLAFLRTRCREVVALKVPLTPRDLDVSVYRFEPGVEPRTLP